MTRYTIPTDAERVTVAIPDLMAGPNGGVTHLDNATVWQAMELLQCHIAAWRLPYEEEPAAALASHRLLIGTARLLAQLTEDSLGTWTAHDGAACTAHLAQLAEDRAAREAHQRVRGITPTLHHTAYDAGTLQGMTGVLTWLSEVLSANGVDVQETLQTAATAAAKE